jgi:Fe-S oxidoreductase
VIKIAGQVVRSQPIETTIESLKRAKAAGVQNIVFTPDNFNKYAQAPELLQAMIDAEINLSFFVQCDTQVFKQAALIELMARAGCGHIFLGAESFDRRTLLKMHKAHNHPEEYAGLVRLCHKHGIQVHFSNMIGFEDDTEDSILEHQRVLMELAPDVAWYYILCPIPGTEQYDEFMAAGLITEPNLDRFDASWLTWTHPHMSKKRLHRLLFDCYKQFYSFSETLRRIKKLNREAGGKGSRARAMGSYRDSFFVRLAVGQGLHPMDGGIYRFRLDAARDYQHLRRKYYDFDLAPLPKSLQLSAQDEEFNRRKKLVLPILEVG